MIQFVSYNKSHMVQSFCKMQVNLTDISWYLHECFYHLKCASIIYIFKIRSSSDFKSKWDFAAAGNIYGNILDTLQRAVSINTWTPCSRLFLSIQSAKLKGIFWKMDKIFKIKKKPRWQTLKIVKIQDGRYCSGLYKKGFAPIYLIVPLYVWMMFRCPLYIHNTNKACFVRLRGVHMPPYVWIPPYFNAPFVWCSLYVWMSHMFGCPHMLPCMFGQPNMIGCPCMLGCPLYAWTPPYV